MFKTKYRLKKGAFIDHWNVQFRWWWCPFWINTIYTDVGKARAKEAYKWKTDKDFEEKA